jgi:hypothetical protein
MKIFQMSAAALALLGLGSIASAGKFYPGGGGPTPSVYKQVRTQAKVDGAMKGIKAPAFKLDYAQDGKSVTVTLSGMTKFNGTATPLPKAQRLPMERATFTLGNVVEGRVAIAVKASDGKVWQPIDR